MSLPAKSTSWRGLMVKRVTEASDFWYSAAWRHHWLRTGHHRSSHRLHEGQGIAELVVHGRVAVAAVRAARRAVHPELQGDGGVRDGQRAVDPAHDPGGAGQGRRSGRDGLPARLTIAWFAAGAGAAGAGTAGSAMGAGCAVAGAVVAGCSGGTMPGAHAASSNTNRMSRETSETFLMGGIPFPTMSVGGAG